MKSKNLKLLFITSNPDVASFVVERGVDRIFLDLEILGKIERQGHLDTVISRHKIEDVSSLRPVVPQGSLLVRLNPVHDGTQAEVDEAIARGADILMLPMFKGPDEVKKFSNIVNGRAKICLLVETIGAMMTLEQCIQVPGINEVHIGLNDLHLEMGCNFMFEPLISGHIEKMAQTLKFSEMPFGIGGLARVGEGLLPADLLLAEHARLGSNSAILSRTFHRQASTVAEIQREMDFGEEVSKLRDAYAKHCASDGLVLNERHKEIKMLVSQIAAMVAARKGAEKRAL